MSVTQLRSSIASMGTDMAVVSLAMGIVQDRVQRLSGDDRADLFELVKDFAKAKSKEDVLEILDTIMEILDGEDHRIEPMDLPVDGKVNAAYKTFVGERIRASRTAAGMTQEQLAEQAGLTREYISQLEHNRRMPGIPVFVRLCRMMNVSTSKMADMLDLVDWKPPAKVTSQSRLVVSTSTLKRRK